MVPFFCNQKNGATVPFNAVVGLLPRSEAFFYNCPPVEKTNVFLTVNRINVLRFVFAFSVYNNFEGQFFAVTAGITSRKYFTRRFYGSQIKRHCKDCTDLYRNSRW